MYGTGYDQRLFLANAAHQGQDEIAGVLIQAGAFLKRALKNNRLIFKCELRIIDEKIANFKEFHPIVSPKVAELFKNCGLDKNCKERLENQRKDLISKYTASVKLLLDHAFGLSLSEGELKFLSGLNISGFNFVGISLEGEPITREKLVEIGLKTGFEGIENAIVSAADLLQLKDESRRAKLLDRLENKFREQGELVSKEGIINLVPIAEVASRGNYGEVKLRLDAGVDPNEMSEWCLKMEGLPIMAAAGKGHFEIVKLLAEHPKIDLKARYHALLVAEKLNFSDIVKFLKPLHSVNDLDLFGKNRLHHAIDNFDYVEVENLLTQGADPNCLDGFGDMPAHSVTCGIIGQMGFRKLYDEVYISKTASPVQASHLLAMSCIFWIKHNYKDDERIIKTLKLLKAYGRKFPEPIESLLTTSPEIP